jgi:hypothetical protein
MISRNEMKVDLSGQLVLLVLGVLLLVFSHSPFESANWGLGLVLAWQAASAAFFWRNYQYRQRGPIFWMLLVIFVLIFFIDLSLFSAILLCLPVLAYLLITLRDTLRVYRRPRSFWDLG